MLSILVANSKGGCGKTTIATNLAAAYAVGGFSVALADADPQHSSLDWCRRRPDDRPPIRCLNWTKRKTKVPADVQRLVIDAPAALGVGRFRELLKMADAVLLPVLPSTFDRDATRRFVESIEELKPIRKSRKPLGIVANMLRSGSKARGRLIQFLDELDYQPVAELSYRAVYGEVAERGFGVFDQGGKISTVCQPEWTPLITFVETLGDGNGQVNTG